MVELYQIEEYVRRREYTDYIMPVWLPFLPLILMLVGGLWFAFFAWYSVQPYYTHYYTYNPFHPVVFETYFFILTLLGVAINVYVVYKWIWRRNEHFKRQKLLLNAIKDFLKERGFNVGKLEMICMDVEVEETERNPILWALIQFIPYVGGILLIYVYHFLNRDFFMHEIREDAFLEGISRLLSDAGIDFNYIRFSYVRDRNTILYLILTLITFGFFVLYWVYTLTKDPNNHFMEHRKWEDQLLNALRRI